MSEGPIPLLSEAELSFQVEEPEFENLVAEELGPIGTTEDGFESVFSEAVAGLGQSREGLESVDADLATASEQFPALAVDVESEVGERLSAAVAGGDSALGDFEGEIPTDATPEVPPATPPEDGGGTGPLSEGGGGENPWSDTFYEPEEPEREL